VGLAVEHLGAWYGQARALDDISVRVDDGEIVGVLGRNGAGKTTLLRSIGGLQGRIDGAIHLDGKRISGLRADTIALRGLTLLREGGQLPVSLTVTQNLRLGQRLARRRGKSPRTLDEMWPWFPLLEPLRDCKAGLLSGGQRQALALAVAFISRPSLLLLDEPSAGLAPPVARELFATIRQLSMTGVTVLIVEQYPAWLLGLAPRGYLLEVGSVTAEGPLEQLIGAVAGGPRDVNRLNEEDRHR
jgi:branched-chain amino acid transport system ATP-binding protein